MANTLPYTTLFRSRAIDDQGSVGNDTIDIVVRNLAPIARLVWRSSSLYVGDHLEVSAETSSDTPSDNLTLRFEWSIDGKVILKTQERTARFKVDDPGKHSLELKVVDDDGAQSEAGPVMFEVKERVDPTPFILIGAAAVLAATIVAALVIGRKVRRLPPPVETEEASAATPEGTGPMLEEQAVSQGIPIPEGLAPPTDAPLPDPPEMSSPPFGEAPRPEPLPPEPVDPEIFS
jgi:hypothetical protein